MASFSATLGRLALFVLITTQSMFLSAYLAKYEGKSNWYFMVISFVPAVVVWIWKSFKSLSLRWLFRIWGLYVMALVVNIGTVVVLVGDRISKTEFLSPNALKAILCITPILLLLLLNTGDLNDSHENYKETEIVSYLCLPMTVDLFDGVEMIDIVLEAREYDFGIPKEFSTAIFALACFGFIVLVSPWHMAEIKITPDVAKIRLHTQWYRNIVQIVCVNVPFLVIRAVVFSMFGKDESIFIAKNGIGIVLSIMEIRNLRHSRRVGQGDQEQQGDQGHRGDQGQRGHQGDPEQQGD